MSIRILNLSVKELKLIAKNRGIKVNKNMSNDELLSILMTRKPPSEPIKNIKEIRRKNMMLIKYLET